MNSIIVVAMCITLAVLVGGLVLMGRGGKLNEKYGNKLMIARVVCQLLTVLLLVVLLFTGMQ